MKRAPKQPKRVRSIVRAATRQFGAPVFVAEAKGRPARLLNVGIEGGELVEGLGVVPSLDGRVSPLEAATRKVLDQARSRGHMSEEEASP